ncbi:MAG: hypothetical protein BHW00_01885 [Clostridium sp. 26_22]|nr:MAG: hypothetical protein BHW00_01885 [Clostridium sp. 26_22]
MKSIVRMALICAILVTCLLIPNVSKATTPINSEETLRQAISSANSGETIILSDNITVTGPIVIDKDLTIDGAGYTVTGADEWTSISGNQTMFAAQLSGAKLTLKNINLKNGPKYGVQSYNGASVVLNNVSITGFNYAGILVNGGTLEIIDVNLENNGTTSNKGIELDRGQDVAVSPSLVMNGSLSSTSKDNIIYVAENAGNINIENKTSTSNKIVAAGNQIVLTDANNNVLSVSALPENTTVASGEQKVILTINYGEKTKDILLNVGQVVSEDSIKAQLNVAEGYVIDGFYTDNQYTAKFNFNNKIDVNTTLYAKVSAEEKQEEVSNSENTVEEENKGEKDETPKTGVANYAGIAVLVIAISAATLFVIIKNRI